MAAPTAANSAGALRIQIQTLEQQLRILKHNLAQQEQPSLTEPSESSEPLRRSTTWPLEPEEYKRYGRQLILPQIGRVGQLRLQSAKVLIVGLGGLGCPAAMYLAGAGCGILGLVDGDNVELSNLHRQVLHTTPGVGLSKVESARAGLCKLNPKVQCTTYPKHLTSTTAIDIISSYDLVLDCTDHPTSRYLISDAAVLAGKPLVSASALQTEGQLMVLNNPPSTFNSSRSGPCYRCIFPKPPPPESVTTCGDGGILGPVVGVMGVLMALETIKVITTTKDPSVKPANYLATDSANISTTMLIFSAFDSPPFRSVRLRGKRPTCPACSTNPSITIDSLRSGSLNYAHFCGLVNPIAILSPSERMTARDLDLLLRRDENPVVIDVRDAVQYDLCHLDKSCNIPYSTIGRLSSVGTGTHEDDHASENSALRQLAEMVDSHSNDTPILFICRFGNDSQLAVQDFRALNLPIFKNRTMRDIRGGFQAWRHDVDPTWPEY